MYQHERIQKQKDIVTKWEKCLSKEAHALKVMLFEAALSLHALTHLTFQKLLLNNTFTLCADDPPCIWITVMVVDVCDMVDSHNNSLC